MARKFWANLSESHAVTKDFDVVCITSEISRHYLQTNYIYTQGQAETLAELGKTGKQLAVKTIDYYSGYHDLRYKNVGAYLAFNPLTDWENTDFYEVFQALGTVDGWYIDFASYTLPDVTGYILYNKWEDEKIVGDALVYNADDVLTPKLPLVKYFKKVVL